MSDQITPILAVRVPGSSRDAITANIGYSPDELERITAYARTALSANDPVSHVYQRSLVTISMTAFPPGDRASASLGERELKVWAAVAWLVFDAVQDVDRAAASALAARFEGLLRDYREKIWSSIRLKSLLDAYPAKTSKTGDDDGTG